MNKKATRGNKAKTADLEVLHQASTMLLQISAPETCDVTMERNDCVFACFFLTPLVTRTLLGAPNLATRSKDATRDT